MLGQQLLGKAVQRRVRRRHLHKDVHAVGILFQHAADAAHLPLDAAEPVQQGLVLLRGAVLVAAAGGDGVRHKDRSPEEYKALVNRLSRIEGQVRGVRGMLEKDAYCVDILVQVAAVNSALNSFAKELLAQHMSTCVADDLRAGSNEKLDELIKLLPRLMK